jgi:hypothetical protein
LDGRAADFATIRTTNGEWKVPMNKANELTVCSICDEPKPDLRPRLWFENSWYTSRGLQWPIKRQWVCSECRSTESRRSLMYGLIVLCAILVAAVVVALGFLYL